MSKIYGNMIGAYSNLGKTVIIEDENGNELAGVVTDQEVIFTATDNDVREGSVYASDSGVSTGTKFIPAYVTHHGTKVIPKNGSVTLYLHTLDCYDYTIFHGIICDYNTNLLDSTAAQQVILYDSVFNVQSPDAIANTTKNHDTKTIVFNIKNESDNMRILRYITYKEII